MNFVKYFLDENASLKMRYIGSVVLSTVTSVAAYLILGSDSIEIHKLLLWFVDWAGSVTGPPIPVQKLFPLAVLLTVQQIYPRRNEAIEVLPVAFLGIFATFLAIVLPLTIVSFTVLYPALTSAWLSVVLPLAVIVYAIVPGTEVDGPWYFKFAIATTNLSIVMLSIWYFEYNMDFDYEFNKF